jgi:hypothetical protein
MLLRLRDYNNFIKINKKNYKIYVLINLILNNIIEKNSITKITKINNSSQPELTCQTHDPGH